MSGMKEVSDCASKQPKKRIIVTQDLASSESDSDNKKVEVGDLVNKKKIVWKKIHEVKDGAQHGVKRELSVEKEVPKKKNSKKSYDTKVGDDAESLAKKLKSYSERNARLDMALKAKEERFKLYVEYAQYLREQYHNKTNTYLPLFGKWRAQEGKQ